MSNKYIHLIIFPFLRPRLKQRHLLPYFEEEIAPSEPSEAYPSACVDKPWRERLADWWRACLFLSHRHGLKLSSKLEVKLHVMVINEQYFLAF